MLTSSLRLLAHDEMPDHLYGDMEWAKGCYFVVDEKDTSLACVKPTPDNKRVVNVSFSENLTLAEIERVLDLIKPEYISIYILVDVFHESLSVFRNEFGFSIVDINPDHKYLMKYSPESNVRRIVYSRFSLL